MTAMPFPCYGLIFVGLIVFNNKTDRKAQNQMGFDQMQTIDGRSTKGTFVLWINQVLTIYQGVHITYFRKYFYKWLMCK